jgi:hypothetical protein
MKEIHPKQSDKKPALLSSLHCRWTVFQQQHIFLEEAVEYAVFWNI